MRQTKAQVKREVKEKGQWKGFVVPCKMALTPQTAVPVKLVWDNELGASIYSPRDDRLVDLETWLNFWSYYNTSWEEGYYAHYYKEN